MTGDDDGRTHDNFFDKSKLDVSWALGDSDPSQVISALVTAPCWAMSKSPLPRFSMTFFKDSGSRQCACDTQEERTAPRNSRMK